MIKAKIAFVVIGACLSGACAESDHRRPTISEAESSEALQDIAGAPASLPAPRKVAEDESLARQGLGRVQAAALPPRSRAPSIPKDDGKWAGQGSNAACGSSWEIDLEVSSRDVSGKLRWSEIDYDLAGRLDEDGKMVGARAAKTRAFANAIGPRFFEINLTFQDTEAAGLYAIKKFDKLSCSTKVTLNKL